MATVAPPIGPTFTTEVARCTPAEYLALERAAENRSEYYDGEMHPMSGASLRHNTLFRNLLTLIHAHLSGKNAQVLGIDMRVGTAREYYYPDLVIVEGAPVLEDDAFDTLLNPAVIIEIASPSTEASDRTRKFADYRRMPSLREYVLVSQARPSIEVFRRIPADPEGAWSMTVAEGPDASIRLLAHATPVVLPLTEIYEGVRQDS